MISAVCQLTSVGDRMHALVSELYPICRSITGPGVRETLILLGKHLPVEVHEVPTGTAVFDWTVPNEWRIRDAYIKDTAGRRVVDFQRSNLHVVNYSVPIRATMKWTELKPHLVTLPEHPDWIPYRTSYYEENWGFCLRHRRFLEMEAQGDVEYEVCIDATLSHGSLTYGEVFLPGESPEEVLISTHICHPSLANDNLSGIAVLTHLAKHLESRACRYSYRFLFIPGTIGAITWLSRNESRLSRIKHGLVVSLAGDAGRSTYKRSRRGDADVDRAAAHVLRHSGGDYTVLDFEPYGYDERQFCSPGFNLPVGCLMRSPHGRYPEYHTSADNLDLVQPEALEDSLSKCVGIVGVLEGNRTYRNRNPKCEPQLGRRGLYHAIGGKQNTKDLQMAMLWVLNLSDGLHSLLDIAERADTDFAILRRAADLLLQHELLRPADERPQAAAAVRVQKRNSAEPCCRFCGSARLQTFVDLGKSPLCETFLTREQLNHVEPFYPLHAFVCEDCLLVQVLEYVSKEQIFNDRYPYFSSYSQSWLRHARKYTNLVVQRFGLNERSQVVEIASNDGYLLQYFVEKGIPALGIEPAANVAAAACKKGVETLVKFFGTRTAQELVDEGLRADLLLGNNVLAHVPQLNDFVAGMKLLLAHDGVITLEFPHLLCLIAGNQFDTIYHEHFCYFSFKAAEAVLAANGLTVFDVEELKSHGGSLRLFARHAENDALPIGPRVAELRQKERTAGLHQLEGYRDFARGVEETKHRLLDFLITVRREGRTVAGYGAPGKGNTLLNYCGIRADLIEYVVDRNPLKHGKYLPGTHIPIFAPEKIAETRPDYVVILPWNLRDEIIGQLDDVRRWGGRFVVPIPELSIVS